MTSALHCDAVHESSCSAECEETDGPSTQQGPSVHPTEHPGDDEVLMSLVQVMKVHERT